MPWRSNEGAKQTTLETFGTKENAVAAFPCFGGNENMKIKTSIHDNNNETLVSF